MLKQLKIRNFEAHRNTTLNFHPGVNVIIGESDQGKSTILRALEWILFNDPLGEDIKSNWLDAVNTYVQAEFDDGILKRKRTKSFNGYILNNDTENPFKGFKNHIPEKIKSFINMDGINLLRQDDSLFMIGWKPSERGRYLNEICDMKIIDTTTSNINKQIRAGNAKIKVLEETVEVNEQDLENFKDLDKMEKKLSHIEKEAEEIQELKEDCEDLTEIIDNLHDINKRHQKYSNVLQFSNQIDTLLKKHQEIASAASDIRELQDYIEDLSDKEAQLIATEEKQKNIQKQFKELMPNICPLCGK